MGNRLGIDISGSIVRVVTTLGDDRLIPPPREDAAVMHRLDEEVQLFCACSESPYEDVLFNFFREVPMWGGTPWVFSQSKDVRVYCFLLNEKDVNCLLPTMFKHLYDLCRRLTESAQKVTDIYAAKVQITGSKARLLINECAKQLIAFNLNKQSSSQPLLNIVFDPLRELTCVLTSIDYLINNMPNTLFHYERTHSGLTQCDPMPPATFFRALNLNNSEHTHFYPYLLVNLKAGVSFHLVTSVEDSCRVGGSPIGCSTFTGLVRLLCNSKTDPFDSFLAAQFGDQTAVDMLVGDIYGGDASAIGLSASLVASTLGKMQAIQPLHLQPLTEQLQQDMPKTVGRGRAAIPLQRNQSVHFKCDDHDHSSNKNHGSSPTNDPMVVRGVRLHNPMTSNPPDFTPDGSDSSATTLEEENLPSSPRIASYSAAKQPTEADLAKSLLSMMTFNVTQLAYYNAVLHKCKRIVFVGYYLEYPPYLAAIQHCINFWSEGDCRVHFVKVAPFLGAFGATLIRKKQE